MQGIDSDKKCILILRGQEGVGGRKETVVFLVRVFGLLFFYFIFKCLVNYFSVI